MCSSRVVRKVMRVERVGLMLSKLMPNALLREVLVGTPGAPGCDGHGAEHLKSVRRSRVKPTDCSTGTCWALSSTGSSEENQTQHKVSIVSRVLSVTLTAGMNTAMSPKIIIPPPTVPTPRGQRLYLPRPSGSAGATYRPPRGMPMSCVTSS